ncbi:MAG: class II aldolase/adducin family protein [Fimbriimonadaceae bacterium]|nr:class II aldolase [Chthonomonadaceae bacterium]MCO5297392.1 class II aldolase/adducin family protein [Fimbriimonadaceae bacterium]
MNPRDTLVDLVAMSRRLAAPELGYAILAEGNTSARAADDSLWIKASGVSLHGIKAGGFVEVLRDPILAALEGPDLDDEAVRRCLEQARKDPRAPKPSVETFLHAWLLRLPDVRFIAHTHPTPLLGLLCTPRAEEFAGRRLFPDEIVCCGPATCWIPYVDPGLPLGRELRDRVQAHIESHRGAPKILWLQNHGLFALGDTPASVEAATHMAVKAAQVWLHALGTGQEPVTLTPEQIERIHRRPDEHYRQGVLGVKRKA